MGVFVGLMEEEEEEEEEEKMEVKGFCRKLWQPLMVGLKLAHVKLPSRK
jgi:hypothetical protein